MAKKKDGKGSKGKDGAGGADDEAKDGKGKGANVEDTKAKDTQSKDTKEMVTKRIKAPLDITLSDAELAQMARDLCENATKIAAKEEEKKNAVDRIKGDIGLLEEAASKIRDAIRAGTVARDVECDLIFDWRSKEVRLVRVDSGEVVKRRTMDKDECQRELFDRDVQHGKLLVFEGGLGKKGAEVTDHKPGDEKAERKTPKPNDAIEVETRSGWKKGKVLPSSGSMLDVELEDGTVVNAPVEGSTWRWPGEGEKLATLGEIAKANADKKPDKRLKDGAPAIADELMVRTPAGPQRGAVVKIEGTLMFIDLGDGGMPAQVDLASKDWSWPKEGEGETDEASGETADGSDETPAPKGKKGKRVKVEDPNGVDITPPPGCDF